MYVNLPFSVTHEVRDACVCMHLQRTARAVARLFDDAFRPIGINNGQFSILMSLNRPDPPRISDVARLLDMDRTTLTAAIKVLERKGLMKAQADPGDRRTRRLTLTEAGKAILVQAVPVWRETLSKLGAPDTRSDLVADLAALATRPDDHADDA